MLGRLKHYATLRESRYVTSQGSDQQLIGQTAASTAALWKFEARTDGTFNIVSAEGGLFITPDVTKNTALKTVLAEPAGGWTIKPADEVGYVIITSGTAEFNQTTKPFLLLPSAPRRRDHNQ